MLFYVLLGLISYYLSKKYYWDRRYLPPGPRPLPIVGNILDLISVNRWETKFIEWYNQYGSVYTYYLGDLAAVAICDYEDMVKYFVKQSDVFSDRYIVESSINMIRGGEYGVISTNGEVWKEQRRFALKVLRDFGLGKNQMEERILAELHYTLNVVNKKIEEGETEIDLIQYTDLAVGSIINAIMAGYRFTEGNEEEFYQVKELTTRIMQCFMSAGANLVFNNPWLYPVPIISNKARETLATMNQIFGHLDKQIQKHLQENDYSHEAEATDYIDAFLLEKAKRERDGGDVGVFNFDQLRNICFDLWLAGQETTSSTITWIIAYLIRHPEAQEKLQEELDSVIGTKRIISNSDRPALPYTNAVIMECQRCCNLLSQNIFRINAEETEINGYVLKKGTIVVPQISVLLQNPKVFPNPERFNPDRFIDENGKLKQVEELIPFSIGKRICLGEGMARMELFIFTANLFNQYKFSAGKVAPSLKKLSGASTMTEPYKCVIERR